jgi:hypothetical protein
LCRWLALRLVDATSLLHQVCGVPDVDISIGQAALVTEAHALAAG